MLTQFALQQNAICGIHYIATMKLLASILSLLVCINAFAQRNQTIRGTVIDGETKQPLIGASVFVQLDDVIGTTTDMDSKFRLISLQAKEVSNGPINSFISLCRPYKGARLPN